MMKMRFVILLVVLLCIPMVCSAVTISYPGCSGDGSCPYSWDETAVAITELGDYVFADAAFPNQAPDKMLAKGVNGPISQGVVIHESSKTGFYLITASPREVHAGDTLALTLFCSDKFACRADCPIIYGYDSVRLEHTSLGTIITLETKSFMELSRKIDGYKAIQTKPFTIPKDAPLGTYKITAMSSSWTDMKIPSYLPDAPVIKVLAPIATSPNTCPPGATGTYPNCNCGAGLTYKATNTCVANGLSLEDMYICAGTPPTVHAGDTLSLTLWCCDIFRIAKKCPVGYGSASILLEHTSLDKSIILREDQGAFNSGTHDEKRSIKTTPFTIPKDVALGIYRITAVFSRFPYHKIPGNGPSVTVKAPIATPSPTVTPTTPPTTSTLICPEGVSQYQGHGCAIDKYSWVGTIVTITVPGEYTFAQTVPAGTSVTVSSSGVTLDGSGVTLRQIIGRSDLDLKNITIHLDDLDFSGSAITDCRNILNSSIFVKSTNLVNGIERLYGNIDDTTSISVEGIGGIGDSGSRTGPSGVYTVLDTGTISGGTFTVTNSGSGQDETDSAYGNAYGVRNNRGHISGGTFTVTGGYFSWGVYLVYGIISGGTFEVIGQGMAEGIGGVYGSILGGDFNVTGQNYYANGIGIVRNGVVSGGTFIVTSQNSGSSGVGNIQENGVVSGGEFIITITNQNGMASGVSFILDNGEVSGGRFTVNGHGHAAGIDYILDNGKTSGGEFIITGQRYRYSFYGVASVEGNGEVSGGEFTVTAPYTYGVGYVSGGTISGGTIWSVGTEQAYGILEINSTLPLEEALTGGTIYAWSPKKETTTAIGNMELSGGIHRPQYAFTYAGTKYTKGATVYTINGARLVEIYADTLSCPAEATGTYPDCDCGTGFTYIPATNTCVLVPDSCPAGATGTYPDCDCGTGFTYNQATNTCVKDPTIIICTASGCTYGNGDPIPDSFIFIFSFNPVITCTANGCIDANGETAIGAFFFTPDDNSVSFTDVSLAFTLHADTPDFVTCDNGCTLNGNPIIGSFTVTLDDETFTGTCDESGCVLDLGDPCVENPTADGCPCTGGAYQGGVCVVIDPCVENPTTTFKITSKNGEEDQYGGIAVPSGTWNVTACDEFVISFDSKPGYELDAIQVNGERRAASPYISLLADQDYAIVAVGAPRQNQILVDFDAVPRTVTVLESVTFTPISTGTLKPDIWDWDFGDGEKVPPMHSDEPVLHTYTMPGHYTVTLTGASGELSGTVTKIGHIFVEPNMG